MKYHASYSLKLAPTELEGNKSPERFSQFWVSTHSDNLSSKALTVCKFLLHQALEKLMYDSGRRP